MPQGWKRHLVRSEGYCSSDLEDENAVPKPSKPPLELEALYARHATTFARHAKNVRVSSLTEPTEPIDGRDANDIRAVEWDNNRIRELADGKSEKRKRYHQDLLTPAAFVNFKRVQKNIETVARLCSTTETRNSRGHTYPSPDVPQRWRPHLKTTKSPAIWRMLIINHVKAFKVATTRELEALVEVIYRKKLFRNGPRRFMYEGVYDILLAYPLAHEASWLKLREILVKTAKLRSAHETEELEKIQIKISVLVEHESMFPLVPRGQVSSQAELDFDVGVFADLNFGFDRTGSTDAETFIVKCAEYFGESFRGVSMYEGNHSHEVIGDELALEVRRERCEKDYELLVKTLKNAVATYKSTRNVDEQFAFRDKNALPKECTRFPDFRVFEVLTSGTPTFMHALESAQLGSGLESLGFFHRVSPGTVVLHDARSARQISGDFKLQHAFFLLSTIISKPSQGIITCDLGSKSLACENGDPAAFVVNHPTWVPLHPSEEHLPIFIPNLKEWENIKRGDRIWLIPEHVCPTVNLHEVFAATYEDPFTFPNEENDYDNFGTIQNYLEAERSGIRDAYEATYVRLHRVSAHAHDATAQRDDP